MIVVCLILDNILDELKFKVKRIENLIEEIPLLRLENIGKRISN